MIEQSPRLPGGLANNAFDGNQNSRPQSPVGIILGRVEQVRRSGRGWTARCPAHEDRWPSLSIAEGRDGRVLLHDHGGCDVDTVVGALGLTMADLFPHDDTTPHRRPQGRRDSRKPVRLPREVAEKLAASPTFSRDWETGKLLAERSAPAAKLDVLAAWDSLSTSCDLPAALALAHVVRGVAVFRYLDGKSIDDPLALRRAVRRLTQEVGRDG